MTRLGPIAREITADGAPGVLVTVADARGSTPREIGARMLVTRGAIHGSVGGGRLEYEAVNRARTMIDEGARHALRRVPLGPAIGQCCGGQVSLLLEAVSAATSDWLEALEGAAPGVLVTPLERPEGRTLIRPGDVAIPALPAALRRALAGLAPGDRASVVVEEGGRWLREPCAAPVPLVVLYGAGHVGRALAAALAPLPCRLRWIDSRAGEFPAQAPDNAEVVVAPEPPAEAAGVPAGAYHLVMTHSHQTDLEICEAVLRRGDFAHLGLIGSKTKRSKFERRLLARGLSRAALGRLICPIGLPAIRGKQPAVIAASVVAQLLAAFEARAAGRHAGPVEDFVTQRGGRSA